jgi:hypothetical protein
MTFPPPLRVDILWFKVNQLLLAFARQQFHRPVTAGKLFVFVAIENQVREASRKERKGGLLFKLNLRLLALLHLHFKLLKCRLTFSFGFLAIRHLLVKPGDVVFKLDIQLQVARASLPVVHQPGRR